MLRDSLSRPLLNLFPNDDVFACLTFLGILLVAAGLAVASHAVAARFFEPYRDPKNSREIAVVAAMVLTMFALLLAFAIVTLYDQHRDAESAVAREASDLTQITRNATAISEPVADPGARPSEETANIMTALAAYGGFVVDKEFRAMHDGRLSSDLDERASICITNLFTALRNADSGGSSWAPFQDAAVKQANDVVAQRQVRLTSTDAALPSAFVFLLFVAGGIAVALMCFVKASDAWVERGLVVSVAVVITSGMLAAFVLEFPFSGLLAISSEPIAQVAQANPDSSSGNLVDSTNDPSCELPV
jgi:hypothetical protein